MKVMFCECSPLGILNESCEQSSLQYKTQKLNALHSHPAYMSNPTTRGTYFCVSRKMIMKTITMNMNIYCWSSTIEICWIELSYFLVREELFINKQTYN